MPSFSLPHTQVIYNISFRYGSGLWHTYLDRDLSIAGRIIIAGKDDTFNTRLVHIKQPILRIPSLAYHCSCPLLLKIVQAQAYLLPKLSESRSE